MDNKKKKSDELVFAEGELVLANKKLVLQNQEKEKRALELLIANQEFAFQNNEKEKRAAELLIANQELAFQNSEKEKRAVELAIANQELAFQNEEKEKRAVELTVANEGLIKIEANLNENIRGLKEMMFITSHKVRQPIANIIGIANLLNDEKVNSFEDLKKLINYIKDSALALDDFTKELTKLMSDLEQKRTNKYFF